MGSLVTVWLACGGIAACVAARRGGRPLPWLGAGLLFGPLALAAAFLAGETAPARPTQPMDRTGRAVLIGIIIVLAIAGVWAAWPR